jgi:hypothetical protein
VQRIGHFVILRHLHKCQYPSGKLTVGYRFRVFRSTRGNPFVMIRPQDLECIQKYRSKGFSIALFPTKRSRDLCFVYRYYPNRGIRIGNHFIGTPPRTFSTALYTIPLPNASTIPVSSPARE